MAGRMPGASALEICCGIKGRRAIFYKIARLWEKRMKNTLNLLGNGFELHFGLRTAWKEFDSFVNDYYAEIAE